MKTRMNHIRHAEQIRRLDANPARSRQKQNHPSGMYPAQQLSAPGNREEFRIPDTPLGNLVRQFRLIWARVNGHLQPCIRVEGVEYPGVQPVTGKEVYGDEA